MSEEYHENGTNEQPNPEPDYEAQQAARNAVMGIRLFPDLPVALKKAIGYGPHVDMLQHLVYWFGRRKMRGRWTLYKTNAEWAEECALSRRQVPKGRKVLRDLGLVSEYKGPRYRVHYRVNWVALAESLDCEFRLHTNTVLPQVAHHGVQARLHTNIVLPNARDYAEDYSQDIYALQASGEPAFAEPPPPHRNGKREEKEVKAQPIGGNRHSQNGHAPSKKQAVKEKVEKPASPPKPDDEAILSDIGSLLDPNSGRWLGAEPARQNPEFYTAEKIAEFMAKDPELPYAGRAEELEPYVRYVMWEAN
jgi:hypothetical protein